MGPLGELGALFNPGMRHEIEERKSKANRREEEGNARDGDVRIDLESGVAVISLQGTAAGKTGPGAGSSAPSAEVDRSDPASGTPAPSKPAGRTPVGQKDRRRRSASPTAQPRGAKTAATGSLPAPSPSSKASRVSR